MNETLGEEATAVVSQPSGERSLVIAPWQGLLVALLAGLAAWGALQLIPSVFQLPEELRAVTGNAPAEQLSRLHAATATTQTRNAMFSVAVLAFALGLSLAAAEQLLRRNLLGAVLGGLFVGLVAGLIAVGAVAVGNALQSSLDFENKRLLKTMVVQGAILGVMGAGIGLALALSLLRPRLLVSCIVGCLLGGMLAALAFPLTAGVFFPDVNTDFLVPEPGLGRLLWAAFASGLIGVTVAGLGHRKQDAKA